MKLHSQYLRLLFLLLLATAVPIAAQDSPSQVIVGPVDDTDYPRLTLTVTPANEAGVPLTGLRPDAFTLLADGQPLTDVAIEPLADPALPVSILLLLDVSASMDGYLPSVKAAVPALYQSLTQTDESAVIAFSILANGTTVDLRDPFPQLHPAREMNFTNDEGGLINLINSLTVEPDAGAPLYDALFKGARLVATQARHPRSAIILISSSGDRNRAGDGPGSIIATADIAIAEARRFGVPVFTIGFGPAVDNAFLQRTAILTGGNHFPVPDPTTIGPILADLAARLRQTYRVTATATVAPDNEVHELAVTVRSNLGTATATAPFIARYGRTPTITAVTAQPLQQEPQPLTSLTTVRGPVVIEPEIVARSPITAVRYQIDDEELAIAQEPPWRITWDSHQWSSSHPRTLRIDAITVDAHTGSYETAVQVQPCNLLCEWSLANRLNPIYIPVTLGLLLALLLLLLLIRSQTPAAAPPTPPPPAPDIPEEVWLREWEEFAGQPIGERPPPSGKPPAETKTDAGAEPEG